MASANERRSLAWRGRGSDADSRTGASSEVKGSNPIASFISVPLVVLGFFRPLSPLSFASRDISGSPPTPIAPTSAVTISGSPVKHKINTAGAHVYHDCISASIHKILDPTTTAIMLSTPINLPTVFVGAAVIFLFALALYPSSLLRWFQRKRYQYEVTFSLYMLTPTEKFIFSEFSLCSTWPARHC